MSIPPSSFAMVDSQPSALASALASSPTLGTSLSQDASVSRRPFFERVRNTHPARSSISHPQLRDLLICPHQAHHVQTVSGNGVDAHVFGQYTMRLMEHPTSFSPNCLVHGFGMVAMGGEDTDLLIRSTDISSRWELKIHSGQSIVNSACFHKSYTSPNANLLVCNNDQTITQYELTRLPPTPAPQSMSSSSDKPVITYRGTIHLPVPVNHCSMSPDTRTMVAVGDSHEVFVYDCRAGSLSDWPTTPIHTLTLPGVPASTGSFSTSWNMNGDKFAVASEAERIVVFDTRCLPRPLLVKHTKQKGRAGAARVVKFTPEGPNELLAFTEHRSFVHVLDARTFDPDHEQILTVPTPLPGLSPFPPRLPPGSIRTGGSRSLNQRLSGSRSSEPRAEAPEAEVEEEDEEDSTEEHWPDRPQPIGIEPTRQQWGSLQVPAPTDGDEEEEAYPGPASSPSPPVARIGGSSLRLLSPSSPPAPVLRSDGSSMRIQDPSTLTPPVARIHGSSMRFLSPSEPTPSSWLDPSGVALRSGMWDDLIGLDWSPDGNWLVSGTEAGIVEWKVKRSARTGFGDARLC